MTIIFLKKHETRIVTYTTTLPSVTLSSGAVSVSVVTYAVPKLISFVVLDAQLIMTSINVNANVNLYSTLSHSASGALGAPSTAEKGSYLIGDRSL